MVIGLLKDYPQYTETVVSWLCNEFGTQSSERFFRALVKQSLNTQKLPITFVAVEDNMLLGTVGIWSADLLSRQDLGPWLSALVVNPKHRNEGIGRRLQEHALNFCREKEIEKLYLYTDIKGYYENFGWVKHGIGYEFSGKEVQIFSHRI